MSYLTLMNNKGEKKVVWQLPHACCPIGYAASRVADDNGVDYLQLIIVQKTELHNLLCQRIML